MIRSIGIIFLLTFATLKVITIEVTQNLNLTMCVALETNKLIHNFPKYGWFQPNFYNLYFAPLQTFSELLNYIYVLVVLTSLARLNIFK